MNKKTLAIGSLALLAVLVIAGVLFVVLNPSRELQNASSAPVYAQAEVGDTAPPFSSPTTQGPFDLARESKPVLLEIFATWCPHCQRETSVLNQLFDKYKSQVAFIAVPGSELAMDHNSPESISDVLAFQQQFKVQYPIAVYDPNMTIANLYLKGGFPTIAIIDKTKTISYLNSGEIAFVELDNELKKVTR